MLDVHTANILLVQGRVCHFRVFAPAASSPQLRWTLSFRIDLLFFMKMHEDLKIETWLDRSSLSKVKYTKSYDIVHQYSLRSSVIPYTSLQLRYFTGVRCRTCIHIRIFMSREIQRVKTVNR